MASPSYQSRFLLSNPPAFHPDEIERALSRPAVANADLILCGHVPYPLAQRTLLPNGRAALVVRGVGWMRGEPDGSGGCVDDWVLEAVGPASLGFHGWALHRHVRPFRPRDPSWTDPTLTLEPSP